MAVEFVLGRSGTGKSRLCIDEIVECLCEADVGGRLVLLLPEQATYQAEKSIVSSGRVCGYHNLEVLSFERLKFKLLGGRALPVLSAIGKDMILNKIVRENADKLKVFGASAKRSGLSVEIGEVISELHRYSKEPEDIENLIELLGNDPANQLSRLKFEDISMVFGEYLKFIHGRFEDPERQLRDLCVKVGESDFINGAKLWVDGFSGFSSSELAVLTEMLRVSSGAKIALCLDPYVVDLDNLDEDSLFYPTEKTYLQLVDVVKESGIELAEPIVLDRPRRFCKNESLGFIEKNLFKFNFKPAEKAEGINIISASNARTEAAYIAKEILKLVKYQGYRFREIAVVVSDIQQYQHYISAYFSDYGIPFFIDHRRVLNKHAVVFLLCSAFDAIGSGFATSDVMAYLKSEFCEIGKDEVNLLENYCLAFGVDGGDWTAKRKWDFAGDGNKIFDDAKVDSVRRRSIKLLVKLKRALAGDEEGLVSSAEFTQAVFNFLDGLGVNDKIGEWIKQAQLRSDHGAAEEHRQFYDKFVGVFDELVEVFGDDKLSGVDYFSVVNAGFAQLKLAFIPPTVDQVLVGSIERSRHPDIKAVFIAGASQKQFPNSVKRSGVLTDADRAAAQMNEFELEMTASQSLVQRQYLAYIAFTRASELLYVCYPACKENGDVEVPSQFIDNVEMLFGSISRQFVSEADCEVEEVHNKVQLADVLCSRCGREVSEPDGEGGRLFGLLDDVKKDKGLRDVGLFVDGAISYENSVCLDPKVVEDFLGEKFFVSATGLGAFASCKYRYFAKYILELKERDDFKMRHLDIGSFYHDVLDRFIKELLSRGLDIAEMSKDDIRRVLGEVILASIEGDPFIFNFSRRSEHNAFIIRESQEVLEEFVYSMSELVSVGDFRPSQSEICFGKDGDDFEIELGGGKMLCFNGKIDRVDVAEIDGRKAALVFDYKLSSKSFNWSKLYNGLDVQMPLYLLAVREALCEKLGIDDVAGAFYMPIKVSYGKKALGDVLEGSGKFLYKPKGVFNGEYSGNIDRGCVKGFSDYYSFFISKDDGVYGRYKTSSAVKEDDFELMLGFAEKKVVELGKDILTGEVDIRPGRLKKESPCSYCEYKALCRFDWQINDYNNLKVVGDKEEAIKEMGGGQ